MCNRLRCVWCRHGVQRETFQFYGHWTLCPEHKRLRNRLQRSAAREALAGDTEVQDALDAALGAEALAGDAE